MPTSTGLHVLTQLWLMQILEGTPRQTKCNILYKSSYFITLNIVMFYFFNDYEPSNLSVSTTRK